MFKEWLKQFLCVILCIVTLLSPITAYADDYVKSDSDDGVTYYIIEGKDVKKLFDFGIDNIGDALEWLFNFKSYTVVKNYTNLDGENTYKVYFNTPNLQSIVKNEVTGLISDGYTDNTYDVNDTQWLVSVGKDSDKVNAITRYGFDIPNYIYQGEYPKEVMTAAGIVPSPKKWWEVLWAAIKAFFGGSILKAPDADNFNSIKYNNHTYTDKEDYIIEYIRRYYIPYLENKMISGSAADYDEDDKKWSDGSSYFDSPEEVMELTVSEDAYDAATEYNDKYEDIYDDAIQHYIYWKYYESKNKSTVGIGSDWWDEYKKSLSGYTEADSYLAELKELGIFSGDNDKLDNMFYQDQWLTADGPKIKLNEKLYGYSNTYTVYDPIWFFASREIYKQNFKNWLDTSEANRKAAIVMLNSIDDSNKKSVLAIGGPTYSDASTYGLTTSKFTSKNDLFNVVDIAATLIKYAEDSIWVKLTYDIKEKEVDKIHTRDRTEYEYYTDIDKITFKLYKHNDDGEYLKSDGSTTTSKKSAAYEIVSYDDVRLNDYYTLTSKEVDNKKYVYANNPNMWYTRTVYDLDESELGNYNLLKDANGNIIKSSRTIPISNRTITQYFVREKVTVYTLEVKEKESNKTDVFSTTTEEKNPVVISTNVEDNRKYTDVSSWIENPSNHEEPNGEESSYRVPSTYGEYDTTVKSSNTIKLNADTHTAEETDFGDVSALLNTPISIIEDGNEVYLSSLSSDSITTSTDDVFSYNGQTYGSDYIEYYISGEVTPNKKSTVYTDKYTEVTKQQTKYNFKEKYVWDNKSTDVTTTVKAFRDWEKAYNLNKYNYQYNKTITNTANIIENGKPVEKIYTSTVKQSFNIDDIVHPDLQSIYTNYNKNKELIKKYKKFSKYMARGWYWEESKWKSYYSPYKNGYKIKSIQQLPYKQCMLYVEDPDKEGAKCESTEYSDEPTSITLANVIVYSGAYKITAKYREAGETEMTVGDAHALLTELQLYCGPYYTDVLANIVKLIAATASYDGDEGPTSMIVDDDPRSMPYDVGTLILADKDNYTVVDPRVSIYKSHTIGRLISDLVIDISFKIHLEPFVINICGKITEVSVFLQNICSFDVLDDLGLSPADMWNKSYIALAIMIFVLYFIIKTVKAVIKMGERSLSGVVIGFLILLLELGLCAVLTSNPEGTWTTIKDFNAKIMSLGEMATIKNNNNLDYLFDGSDDFQTIYYLPYLDTWSKFNTGYGLMDNEQLIPGSDEAELIKFNNPQLNGNDIKHWSVLLADSFEYHGANDTYLALYEDGKFINGENINNNAYRVVDHFMAPRVEVTQSGEKVYLAFSENENYNSEFQNGFGAMMVKLLNCILGCYLSLIKCMIFIFFWWQFYIFVFRIVLGLTSERKKMSDIIKETFIPLLALVLFGTLSTIFIVLGMEAEGFFGAILIFFMGWLTMVVLHWWYTKEYRYFPFTLKWVYYYLTPFGRRSKMRKDSKLTDSEESAENINEEFDKYFNIDGTYNKDTEEILNRVDSDPDKIKLKEKLNRLYIHYRNLSDPGQNTGYQSSATARNAVNNMKYNEKHKEILDSTAAIDDIMDNSKNRNSNAILKEMDKKYRGKSKDEIREDRKLTKERQEQQKEEKKKKENEESTNQNSKKPNQESDPNNEQNDEQTNNPEDQKVNKPDKVTKPDKSGNRKITKKKKPTNPKQDSGNEKIDRK